MLVFQNLPEEIRAKIMYGGYIIHPSAQIIKDFFNNLYIKISQNEEDSINIYNHLINIGELKEKLNNLEEETIRLRESVNDLPELARRIKEIGCKEIEERVRREVKDIIDEGKISEEILKNMTLDNPNPPIPPAPRGYTARARRGNLRKIYKKI